MMAGSSSRAAAIMKKITSGILPIVVSAVLSGCASHHQEMTMTTYEPVTTTRTTRTVTVTQAPPAPRVEVETTAPSPAHVWMQGYWMHVDNRWIWVPGHWEMRPREGAQWVPGHWDKDPVSNSWVWTDGRWQ
jgi:hypothetical protein